jgi:hypothetical protein
MEIKKDGESHTGRNRSLALRNERLTGRPLGRFEHEVDRADALVQEAIGRLSQHYPEHATCGAALEDLQKLRPHFQRALAALTEIERCRGLTQKELSRRRAFKILVEGGEGRVVCSWARPRVFP